MDVNITITGSGLSYEGKTELSKAATIIKFLTDSETSAITDPSSPGIQKPKSWKSPRQTVVDLGATTNSDKIAAFLRYYLDKENRLSLTLKEIEQVFIRSGEKRPANLYRDLRKAIHEKGYISESSDGSFSLTDYGQEVTHSGFKSEA